jgi:hypothetical protein
MARLPSVLEEVRPKLMLLCMGGNDMLRKMDRLTIESNLRAMVQLARERGVGVVLIGVPEPVMFGDTAPVYGNVAKDYHNLDLDKQSFGAGFRLHTRRDTFAMVDAATGDEGWKVLDDPVFVRRIKDWEKTIRKRNGVVGFCTQSASDALDSRIASAIIEQAATQIFFPNSRAKASDYVDGFGLTEHEFELVRSLPDTSRCFLIKRGDHSVVARLDLTGLGGELAVLAGTERTVRRLSGYRNLRFGRGVPMPGLRYPAARLTATGTFARTHVRQAITLYALQRPGVVTYTVAVLRSAAISAGRYAPYLRVVLRSFRGRPARV